MSKSLFSSFDETNQNHPLLVKIKIKNIVRSEIHVAYVFVGLKVT